MRIQRSTWHHHRLQGTHNLIMSVQISDPCWATSSGITWVLPLYCHLWLWNRDHLKNNSTICDCDFHIVNTRCLCTPVVCGLLPRVYDFKKNAHFKIKLWTHVKGWSGMGKLEKLDHHWLWPVRGPPSEKMCSHLAEEIIPAVPLGHQLFQWR